MHLQFTIDWYQATSRRECVIPTVSYAYPCGMLFVRETSPRGYNYTIANACLARISLHTTRDEQGVQIQYSGRSLNAYELNGHTKSAIVRWHTEMGDKPTRLDLAIDVHDSALNIRQLHKRIREGKVTTTLKKHVLVDSESGLTLYIGARTSEQFIRIYDKALEQKVNADWKRVELELKGDRAQIAAKHLATLDATNQASYTQAIMKGLIDFQLDVWTAIVSDLAEPIGKSDEKGHDTIKWLLGQVAPAMGKYIGKHGDNGLTEKFLIVVAGFAETPQE